MPPLSVRDLRYASRRIKEIGAHGGDTPEAPTPGTIQLHVGRITSTSKTEDRYPGTRYDYFANTDNAASPPAGSYVEGETIWIKSRRSETLAEDVNYDLALVGVRASDGIPIYAVVSPPTSSAIGARMTASGTQAITTALQTQVTWDVDDWDNDSLVDLSNDRFNINTAGRYLVTCTVQFATNSTGAVRRLRLSASAGTPAIFAAQTTPPGNFGGDQLSCSGIVQLADTDTVHALVYQDSGGNLNLTSERVMAIEYLGPTI